MLLAIDHLQLLCRHHQFRRMGHRTFKMARFTIIIGNSQFLGLTGDNYPADPSLCNRPCLSSEKETVEHFLTECPSFWEERQDLRRKVGVGRMRIAILLGDK